MASRYWKVFGRNSNQRPLAKSRKQKTCIICGRPATVGNMCQSCGEFIRRKKEDTRKK